jgi:hypothetical protein
MKDKEVFSEREVILVSVDLGLYLNEKIEECIGFKGADHSEVIRSILLEYFLEPENQRMIDRFKRDKREIERLRRISQRDMEVVDRRVGELLAVSVNISPSFLIENSEITEKIFRKNLVRWAKKFNFKIEDDKIIKAKNRRES